MALSGKTGSHTTEKEELGWFVGHLTGARDEYVVIANFTGPKSSMKEYPGLIAKGICTDILKDLKLY
jgi:beta-lactamase class D